MKRRSGRMAKDEKWRCPICGEPAIDCAEKQKWAETHNRTDKLSDNPKCIEAAAIYKAAWTKWGNLQFVMVIEECSELIKAITKYTRNKSHENGVAIAEEAADVEIMVEQLRALSPEWNMLIDREKVKKLNRLGQILQAAEKAEEKQ
jgi:hypothetical protein